MSIDTTIISKEELKELMEEYNDYMCCEKCANMNKCWDEGCIGFIPIERNEWKNDVILMEGRYWYTSLSLNNLQQLTYYNLINSINLT